MDPERQPMMGSVTVEGGKRATRIDFGMDEAKWSELRTDPKSWDMDKPQWHEGRGGRPLIVLIGWNGHTAQQISHVVYYWQDMGCAVLRLTGSLWAEHDPSNSESSRYELYHQYIRTFVMPNKGFLVHAMSSTGATVLSQLVQLDAATGRDMFTFCRGIIYDSGPAIKYPDQYKNSIFSSMSHLSEEAGYLTSAAAHRNLAPVISLLWTPFFLLILLYHAVFYRSKQFEKAEKTFLTLTTGLPGVRVHILASECDNYCSCDDARHFATLLEGTSKVKVTMTDTAHCCHLLEAPEIVRPALHEFLLKCIDD